MITITLRGREIPLLYTTLEMLTIQAEIAPIDTAVNLVTGHNPEDPKDTNFFAGKDHLDALGKMVAILGNAGLEDAGEEPDLTKKNVLRALRPTEIFQTVSACMDAMADGMASEIPKEKSHGPVDVTLEEINKKKRRQTDLPDGGFMGADRGAAKAGD